MSFTKGITLAVLIIIAAIESKAQDSKYFDIENSPSLVSKMVLDSVMSPPYSSDHCKWDLFDIFSHLINDYETEVGYDGQKPRFEFGNPEILATQLSEYKILSPTIEKVLGSIKLDEYNASEIQELVQSAALYDVLNVEDNRKTIAKGMSKYYGEFYGIDETIFDDYIIGEEKLAEFVLKMNILIELEPRNIYNSEDLREEIFNFFTKVFEPLDIEVDVLDIKDAYIISNNGNNYPISKNYFPRIQSEMTKEDTWTTDSRLYELLIPYLSQLAADNNFEYSFGILPMSNIFLWKGVSVIEGEFSFLTKGFEKLMLQRIPISKRRTFNEINVSNIKNGMTCSSTIEIKNLLLTGENGNKHFISINDKIRFIEFSKNHLTKYQEEKATEDNLSDFVSKPDDLSTFLTHSKNCNYSYSDGFKKVIETIDTEIDSTNSYSELFSLIIKEFDIENITLDGRMLNFDIDGKSYSCKNQELYLLVQINEILGEVGSDKMIYRLPMGLDRYLHAFYLNSEEKKQLEEIFGKELKVIS